MMIMITTIKAAAETKIFHGYNFCVAELPQTFSNKVGKHDGSPRSDFHYHFQSILQLEAAKEEVHV